MKMSVIIKVVPFQRIETPYESITCKTCGCGRGISENGVESEWAAETRNKEGMSCNEYFESDDCTGTMVIEAGNYVSRIPSHTLVKCDCGREVECSGFTSTCDCGLDYNGSGQQLAPREQWGEETGEHWTDIINAGHTWGDDK